ncbi:hypothetical protein [Streptomyces sp. NPDC051132]|uniref:hypothetical protein n=1 Tax=unclassified Streptomyces TaxID=2593676 RepID=UPI003443BAA3
MTEQRPGPQTASHLALVSPDTAPPRGEASAPTVHLVITVDLTGRYTDSREVTDAFRTQTRRITDCDVVHIRLGHDAVRHQMGLGQAIAGRFFLSAGRIDVHVPAGDPLGPLVQRETARYVRLFWADHAATTGRSSPAQ